MRTLVALAVAATGCSNLLGIEKLHPDQQDAGVKDSSGMDMSFPGDELQVIKVSGTITEISGVGGGSPAANASIEFRSLVDTLIASATSDANGKYTVMLPFSGAPVDGYLSVKRTGDVDVRSYLGKPLTADAVIDARTATPSTYNTLAQLAGVTQPNNAGVIVMLVVDGLMSPVASAIGQTQPSTGITIRYSNNGIPSSSLTSTGADGFVYAFAATGNVICGATRAATNFGPRTVTVPPMTVVEVLLQ